MFNDDVSSIIFELLNLRSENSFSYSIFRLPGLFFALWLLEYFSWSNDSNSINSRFLSYFWFLFLSTNFLTSMFPLILLIIASVSIIDLFKLYWNIRRLSLYNVSSYIFVKSVPFSMLSCKASKRGSYSIIKSFIQLLINIILFF